jgi:hypothetical protein
MAPFHPNSHMYSFHEVSNILVAKETKTRDHLLSGSDFAVFEYHNYLQAKKYPLLVLSYVGNKAPDVASHEIVWGVGGVEKEIQAMKMNVIRATPARA